MTKNMGQLDRAIRAIVGIVLIGLYFVGSLAGTLGVISVVVGVVLLATAAMGWCPPYQLLGIKTCSTKDA